MLDDVLTGGGLMLGWNKEQWDRAIAFYGRDGATMPDKSMKSYVAVRHEWQTYKGTRLP